MAILFRAKALLASVLFSTCLASGRSPADAYLRSYGNVSKTCGFRASLKRDGSTLQLWIDIPRIFQTLHDEDTSTITCLQSFDIDFDVDKYMVSAVNTVLRGGVGTLTSKEISIDVDAVWGWNRDLKPFASVTIPGSSKSFDISAKNMTRTESRCGGFGNEYTDSTLYVQTTFRIVKPTLNGKILGSRAGAAQDQGFSQTLTITWDEC